MKTVGIDIGYGFLKIYDGKMHEGLDHIVLPSVIGNSVELSFEIPKTKTVDINNLYVKVENEEYFVGELAITQSEKAYRSLSTERTTDMVTKVMFLTGLGLLMEDAVESFVVVTGLPVQDFSLYKQTYIDAFTGTHEIEICGQKKIIHIQKIIVVPQPYGTFCDGLFKADGDVDEDFANNHIGILDIGFKTSDFIQIKKYTYLEKYSSTSPTGISMIYTDVKNYLNTKHGIHKEDFELEENIKSKKLKTRKEEIDLSEVIRNSKKSLAKKIATEVQSLWKNSSEISVIIISGGGGALLYDELTELLGDDIVLATNPQIANVRGYRNWGVYLEGDA